jgi:uncharacterized damage-inducible protein DinB
VLIESFKSLFDRNLARLEEQISAYPNDESLWVIQEGIANSAGNLCLHLIGNLNEYVARQLGRIPYKRNREAEFNTPFASKTDLLEQLSDTRRRVAQTLAELTDADLDKPYPENALGYLMTNHYFLIHLSGHLMYHLGQIDYHRRLLTGGQAVSYKA